MVEDSEEVIWRDELKWTQNDLMGKCWAGSIKNLSEDENNKQVAFST